MSESVMRFFFHERIAFWHQHAPMKAKARKAHKCGDFFARRGRKAKVSAGRYKLNDLIRIALTKAEMDVREAPPKKLHHRHQDIARVHMGRPNRAVVS